MSALLRLIAAALLTTAIIPLSLEAQEARRDRWDRHRISTEEIEASPAANAYVLVERLRPQWLRVRGSSTLREGKGVADPTGLSAGMPAAEIIIYVDGIRRGPHQVLRSMSLIDIASLEYHDATSATQRFGSGHEHGVIVVNRRQ